MEENDKDLELETEQGEGEEEGDKKPELTPEQIKGIKQRKFTKLAKELGIELPKPETSSKIENKKEGFDYAEKAYLKASGIQSDEYDFVKEVMDSTGKNLDQVLEAKYFQSELKERREAKATKDAIPDGKTRGAGGHRDSVEYWIAKGELPPPDQIELRRKVVNAKIKANNQGSKFAQGSVRII